MLIRFPFLLSLLCLLPSCPAGAQYRGFTGTVHQLGGVAAMNITSVPDTEGQQTFRDLGVGAVYDLHYYATRQIALEAIASVLYTPARYLRPSGADNPRKMIIPLDGRVYIGPSEDLQMYIGAGLQWNVLAMKTAGMAESTASPAATGSGGSAAGETVAVPDRQNQVEAHSAHQLSGNAVVGLTILGPQRYMVHFTLGAKFHFPIINNSGFRTVQGNTQAASGATTVTDLSRDRDCVTLGGGITFDLDRHKRMSAMLNYEYPLGTLHPLNDDGTNDHRLAHQTQTISLGLVFHIGGTR